MILVSQLKKQFESVKNSMAVEGLVVTPEVESLVLDKISGKITLKEFDEKVRAAVAGS